MKVAFRNTMIVISAVLLVAFWGLSAFGAITAVSNWDTIKENLTPTTSEKTIIKKVPYKVIEVVTVEGNNSDDNGDINYPDDGSSNLVPDENPDNGNPEPETPMIDEEEKNSPFRGKTLYDTIRDSIISLETATFESAVNVRDEDIKGSVVNFYIPEGGHYEGEYEDIQKAAKKLGVTINVTKVGSGYDYILDVQKAIDDGKKVDLFTVDASQWGPVYKYALPVNDLVNFSKLGTVKNGFRTSMMDSFSMTLSEVNGEKNKMYYSLAGYAEPYLLVYDKTVASAKKVDPKYLTDTYGKIEAEAKGVVAVTDEKGNPVLDENGVCATSEVKVKGKVITMKTIKMDGDFKPCYDTNGKLEYYDLVLRGIVEGDISGRWNHNSFVDVMQKVTDKEAGKFALVLPNGDLHRQLIWSIYKIPSFNLDSYKEIRENVVTNSALNSAFSNFNVYRCLDTSADKIGAALLHYIKPDDYKEKLNHFSTAKGACLGTSANKIHDICKGVDKSFFFWSCMGEDLPEISKNNPNWEFVQWPNGINTPLGAVPVGVNATAAYIEGYCVGKNSNEALAAARVAEELTILRNERHQASLKGSLSEEQMKRYIELKDSAYSSDFNAVTNLINSSDKFTKEEKATDYDECWFSGNLKGNTERFGYFKKKDDYMLTTVKIMRESYGCYAEKYDVLYKIYDVFSDKYKN